MPHLCPVERAEYLAARRASPIGYFTDLMGAVRQRAKKKEFILDFGRDYLLALLVSQGGRCAVTGRQLTFGGPGRHKTNASVDRIDGTRGYEKGNVRLVCDYINIARRDCTDAEFVAWCRAVVERADA